MIVATSMNYDQSWEACGNALWRFHIIKMNDYINM